MNQMAVTWASRTGRCTSLAVKAVHNLGGPAYDWCIYDLEGHRVARCRRTGIVIDSSSTVEGGAFILPGGKWARFEGTNTSWKFKSSESKFES